MTTSITTPHQAAMRRLVRIIQDPDTGAARVFSADSGDLESVILVQDPDTGAARVFSADSGDLESVILVAQLAGIPVRITHVDLRTCSGWEQVVLPEEIL